MGEKQAHRICKSIQTAELDCYASKTVTGTLFIKKSKLKAHEKILEPNGVIKIDMVRIGPYGKPSLSEYGIRTHPAEEIYTAVAGYHIGKVRLEILGTVFIKIFEVILPNQ